MKTGLLTQRPLRRKNKAEPESLAARERPHLRVNHQLPGFTSVLERRAASSRQALPRVMLQWDKLAGGAFEGHHNLNPRQPDLDWSCDSQAGARATL